ncbi:MAG: hypothetical protein IPP69_01095 [Flavobacteriales bacterium]|nr:hypothetical protein [Flavobacteriales bacterium]
MHNKFYQLFAALLVFVFIASCGEKEKAGPAIYIDPSALVLTSNAGDLLEFTVNAKGGDFNLQQIKIMQKPEGGVTSTLLDTLVSGSQTEFFYVYQVPAGSPRILLTFKAIDTDGNEASTLRDLYVESSVYLTETSGHELYSPFHFGANNAFDISSSTWLQLDTDPDSALVDLMESDDTDDGVLSLDITSWSGIRFVRNNAFNYAEATGSSAMNSYQSSIPQQLITDVQVNDILITEYDTIEHKFAVIKLTGIYDDTDPNLDRYTFSLKK